MKKIGFFLGYAPEQPIQNQGIGRLMAFILSGILEDNDTKIIVAMPKWYKKNLLSFLMDQNIDASKIELLTTRCIPTFFKIKAYFSKNLTTTYAKTEAKIRFLKKLVTKIKKKFFPILVYWLSLPVPGFLLLIPIFLFTGLLLSPLFLVIGILLGFRFFCRRYLTPLSRVIQKLTSLLRGNLYGGKFYSQTRHYELSQLVSNINKRKDIELWFIPAMLWQEIEGIKAKKVLAAPDIVYAEFGTSFLGHYDDSTYRIFKKTLTTADHLICYSEHVKQTHLVNAFKLSPEKISVIKHGCTNLSNYLSIHEGTEPVSLKETSLNILRAFQKERLSNDHYLSNFDFTNTRYIFYSSQIRPHKNFYTLIKMYQRLLRDRFVDVKLIVTGSFADSPKIRDYLIKNRLQYDIISLPDVPSNVLAALNHLAVCAINPTLFEGGFPFTFSEAYSVETPSVMSSIPVVLAEIDDLELRDKMLFDPYNLNDMLDKVEWAVQHPEELYQMQKPLYEKFQKRDWKTAASDYLTLFQKIADENSH